MSQTVMLLVEDNPADVLFFREALEATGLPADVEVADNGEDAMQFLRRRGRWAAARRPDVIVLDLNVPMRNGQEVLVELAGDTELNTIPVAVLTTSTSEACVTDLYPPGRCLYFVKTADFGQLQQIVRKIAAHAAPPAAPAGASAPGKP
jgi:CheY-like chemotaxis protein